jgi:hypothetical protein
VIVPNKPVESFYENVQLHVEERRELAAGETVQNIVLEFTRILERSASPQQPTKARILGCHCLATRKFTRALKRSLTGGGLAGVTAAHKLDDEKAQFTVIDGLGEMSIKTGNLRPLLIFRLTPARHRDEKDFLAPRL